MQRETRYVVMKLKDIDKYLSDTEKRKLSAICSSISNGRAVDNRSELKCVVVEDDWPEYETTWKALEQSEKNVTSS